jgi:uncharacterized OB-fold protein
MTTEYKKPLPRPGNPALTKPFWDAAKKNQLVLQRCNTCSNLFFYPREACPSCLSAELEWVPVSGSGRVYSYTIVHQPQHPAFEQDSPYIFAMIQLEEGPRMVSNVVDCQLDQVKIDMPVIAVFDKVTPDWTLVKFKPA